MDDPKLQAQENRGREAAQVLEAPVFKDAIESVRDVCLKTFATDALDPEQLLRAWLVYRLALKLEDYIKRAIRDGADASKLLAAIAKTEAVNGQG